MTYACHLCEIRNWKKLEERARFELARPVKALRFSRPLHSTALPPLQGATAAIFYPSRHETRCCRGQAGGPPYSTLVYRCPAIVAILILAATAATRADFQQAQATAMVSRVVQLADGHFNTLIQGPEDYSHGGNQMMFPIKDLPSRSAGWCNLADRPDERVMFCHLNQHGTLAATVAYYLPAIRRGLPSTYKPMQCPIDVGDGLCKAWQSSRHRAKVYALFGRGDGGGYAADIWFRIAR